MFSSGFREAVKLFFFQTQQNLDASSRKTEEITAMMTVMYRKFSTEHGLALSTPMPFSLDKYLNEITMIEGIYQRQFGPAAIMTTRTNVLMAKFFDSIASRVKHCFLQANRDVEAWLKVVMAPLEVQIREHKGQLKRRRESIEKIHLATDSLEEKVASLEKLDAELSAHSAQLARHEQQLHEAIHLELIPHEMAA
jgi:hypothetical protein